MLGDIVMQAQLEKKLRVADRALAYYAQFDLSFMVEGGLYGKPQEKIWERKFENKATPALKEIRRSVYDD